MRTYQFQVCLTDDDDSSISQLLPDIGLVVCSPGILSSFLVVAESTELHAVESLMRFDGNVKTTCQVSGEVEFRHLKEKLVFVDGVRIVDKHEEERRILFLREILYLRGVLTATCHGTVIPYVDQVKLTPLRFPSRIHAIDNHACHLTQPTIRILCHDSLHARYTRVDIPTIELTECSDKQELITIGTLREPLVGYRRIAVYFRITAIPESIVCRRIEGVFYFHTLACVLFEIRIRQERRPFTLRELLLQQTQVVLRLQGIPLARVK